MANKYLDDDGLRYLWSKIIGRFVEKEANKGLSTNDYTTTDMNKLAGIAEGAEANVQADWEEIDTTSDAYIRNKPTIPPGVTVDSAISSTSENPVQNKVIYTALSGKVDTTSVGANNGVCPLDNSGKVASSYLPSYVDDVIEGYPRSGQTELSKNWLATGSASGTVIAPESGKIYILMAATTNYKQYDQFRYGGSTYVKISDGNISAITNAEIDVIVTPT